MIDLDSRSAWIYKVRLFGFSPLAWVNLLFLQWFCIRLRVRVSYGCGCFTVGLLGPVLPLTGWWSDYVWLANEENRFL